MDSAWLRWQEGFSLLRWNFTRLTYNCSHKYIQIHDVSFVDSQLKTDWLVISQKKGRTYFFFENRTLSFSFLFCLFLWKCITLFSTSAAGGMSARKIGSNISKGLLVQYQGEAPSDPFWLCLKSFWGLETPQLSCFFLGGKHGYVYHGDMMGYIYIYI